MPPASAPNGEHNQMPLTEYSAAPTKMELQDPPASYAIPPEYLLPDGYPDYLRLILASRVYEAVQETPLTQAQNLSQRYHCNILLKREDLQPVFSFKLRGAYNKMAHLDEESRWKGVIAVSAGNHAQGVAYSARKLKIPATIVMPSGTPSIKHLNVSRLGGSVILTGEDFDSAKAKAQEMEKVYGLTNIPPFDDPYVIAGQGTIGMELLRQTDIRRLKAMFCCVGGGGLIAGVGFFIKRIAPQVKIIGVETLDANAMVQSLKAGRRVSLSEVGLFADGAAVKTVGEETFRLCRDVVDEIIEVTTDETCAAIKDMFEDTRSIVEPAGALALAGLKKYIARLHPPPNSRPGTSSGTPPTGDLQNGHPPSDPNLATSNDEAAADVDDEDRYTDTHPSTDQYVALASGANMNFDRLRFVAERATLGENREVLLAVTIPERPGTFATLINLVLPHAVTEFSYRYASSQDAHVLMGISILNPVRREKEVRELIDRLHTQGGGMRARDLSGDELAKSHIRYLVGGKAGNGCADEKLYMFEFPERPGALVKFLQTLRPDHQRRRLPTTTKAVEGHLDAQISTGIQTTNGDNPADVVAGHNISLFHYRNMGGDVGKILAGIQCPEGKEQVELEVWLRELGYPFVECTGSESYRMFLRED